LKKLVTYFRYLFDYLKFGDFASVVASVKYLVNKTSHGKNRIIHTSIGTFYCRKNTNDFQFANYYCEWGVKKFVLDHLKDFTVFIDGGACTGDYTILLSKQHMRCIAFEPIPDNYETLVKNISLNDLDSKVESYMVGLGNENKPAWFRFNPVNTGASHIDKGNDPTGIRTEIRTIDSLLPALKISTKEKILFKLDVEGMEPEALQGSTEFIRQYPNITFIMEDKHSGQHSLRTILNKEAVFEYGAIDEYNIYARKIRNLN
jgi:FkbM family methyltransferase